MNVISESTSKPVNVTKTSRVKRQSEWSTFGQDFPATLYDRLRHEQWHNGEPDGIEVIASLFDDPDTDTDLIT